MSIIRPPDLLGQLSIADMDELMKETYIGGKTISEQIFERNYLSKMDFIQTPGQKLLFDAIKASSEFFNGSSLPHLQPWMSRRPIFRDFLWGPNGEWTGMVRTEDFREFEHLSYGEVHAMIPIIANARDMYGRGITLPFRGRVSTGNCWADPDERIMSGTFLSPYATASSTTTDVRVAIFFGNYHAMMEYIQFMTSSASMDLTPITLEMASFIQCLDLYDVVITQWCEAMMKSKHKYGYGALRDGGDRFSPLGIALDSVECEWIWDHDDAEWRTTDCDENSVISAARAREIFRMPSGLSNDVIDLGIRLLIAVSDKFSDFGSFCKNLKSASAIVETRKQLIQRAFNQNDGRRAAYMDSHIGLVRPEKLYWNSSV